MKWLLVVRCRDENSALTRTLSVVFGSCRSVHIGGLGGSSSERGLSSGDGVYWFTDPMFYETEGRTRSTKTERKKERMCQTQFQDRIRKREAMHKRCLMSSRGRIPIQICQIMQLIIYATV